MKHSTLLEQKDCQNKILSEKLLYWNQQGLIPGPKETMSEFLQRVDYCLNLKKLIANKFAEHFSKNTLEDCPESFLEEAYEQTVHLYDIRPSWILVLFSNEKLSIWHGGCAWIFQMTKKSPTAALLQLRQTFKKSPFYLKFYERKELIAHELAHVGRMLFEEPKYEEILAYRTATSTFRRYFGPLFQSSSESAFFVLSLFLIFCLDIFLLITANISIYHALIPLKAIPIVLILLAFFRLYWRQKIFRKCLFKLHNVLQDKANPVIYRLTDQEITAFAHMTSTQIFDYVAEQRLLTLRWQILHQAYFLST